MRRRRLKRKIRLMAWGLVLTLFVGFAGIGTQTALHTVCESRARLLGMQVLNDAMEEYLETIPISSGDLILLDSNASDQVSSIQVDVIEANRIRTELSDAVIDHLSQMEPVTVWIPLGSFFGNRYLMGLGPKIPLELSPGGSLKSEVISTFDNASINQTRHRLLLSLTAQMYCMAPFLNCSAEVTSEFALAETLVVGQVPETYTEILGSEEDELADLMDYAN